MRTMATVGLVQSFNLLQNTIYVLLRKPLSQIKFTGHRVQEVCAIAHLFSNPFKLRLSFVFEEL